VGFVLKNNQIKEQKKLCANVIIFNKKHGFKIFLCKKRDKFDLNKSYFSLNLWHK